MTISNPIVLEEGTKQHASFLKTLSKLSTLGNGGCIEWQGQINENGYGLIGRQSKGVPMRSYFAHRIAYAVFKGPIGENLQVMHRCDNRLCVNPSHLDLGTQEDNQRDKIKKGRQSKGEAHGSSCLKAKDIIDIRASQNTCQFLANKYGVCQQQISAIKNFIYWKHIREEV